MYDNSPTNNKFSSNCVFRCSNKTNLGSPQLQPVPYDLELFYFRISAKDFYGVTKSVIYCLFGLETRPE